MHPRPAVDAHRERVADAVAQRCSAESALNVEREFCDERLESVAAEKLQVHCSLLNCRCRIDRDMLNRIGEKAAGDAQR